MQLGDDVIVDQVLPQHLAWLRCLDGGRTCDELLEDLTIPVAEARRLLRALARAGALVDAAHAPEGARWADRHRRDIVADQYESLLSIHRDPWTSLRIVASREQVRVAIWGEGQVRDDTAAAVSAAGLTEVASPAKATVLVLADAHHPDVPAHVAHEGLDLPHLHIGAHASRAVVGPLVVPGRTSCLRCAHLHRRDQDRAWPLLAVQWSQSSARMRIDPLLSRAASTRAALALRAWVDTPERVEAWAQTAWEITMPEGSTRQVARPAHPLCGCLWAADDAFIPSAAGNSAGANATLRTD
jgi:hypothetical protein